MGGVVLRVRGGGHASLFGFGDGAAEEPNDLNSKGVLVFGVARLPGVQVVWVCGCGMDVRAVGRVCGARVCGGAYTWWAAPGMGVRRGVHVVDRLPGMGVPGAPRC